MVQRNALASQQDVQPPVAEPPPLTRKDLQPLPDLGQHRSTQRKMPTGRTDEAALTAVIVERATRLGRYGYRRITALRHAAGWMVNVKRVERT
ncbi:hypothetical protein GCM10028812_52890 [Ancylobacter sonchi]